MVLTIGFTIVDGVLVTDAETGADTFYFDYQTEFLVAVDCWNQVISAEQLSENPVTGKELLSDEWFPWTKYLLSKTGTESDLILLELLKLLKEEKCLLMLLAIKCHF